MALRGYRMSDVDWALERMAERARRGAGASSPNEPRLRSGSPRTTWPSGGPGPAQAAIRPTPASGMAPSSPVRSRGSASDDDRAGGSVDAAADPAGPGLRGAWSTCRRRSTGSSRPGCTRSRAASSIPQVGSRLAAFTGVVGIGFLDTMMVTEYDPPQRWVIAKDGRPVAGRRHHAGRPVARRRLPGHLGERTGPAVRRRSAGWAGRWPDRCAPSLCGASLRRMARQLTHGALPLDPAAAGTVGSARAGAADRGTRRPPDTRRRRPVTTRPPPPAVGRRQGRRCWWGASAPEYVEYHDERVGPCRCTATTRCTSGCAWRRSSPA